MLARFAMLPKGKHPRVISDEIRAGAEDAARHMQWKLTGSGIRDASDEEPIYSFRFEIGGQEATVEFLAEAETVMRSGLTAREFARNEIIDALSGDDRAATTDRSTR